MRFRIEREPWIIGAWSIPPTTEIDMSKPGHWALIAKGHVPPLNAVPLDQECADLMFAAYQWGGHERIHLGPGVKRR